MKAAVLEGIKKMNIREVPTPMPKENEVLVKVKACGICQTDYSAYTGARTNWKPPIIMGHEMSGTVEMLGEKVSDFKEGDEVIVCPLVFCGDCRNCKLGLYNYCQKGIALGGDGQDIVLDGGFAEYILAPVSSLYYKPENISFSAAALTEPLAGSYKGLIEYTNLKISEDIVIIGAGSMGLLVTMIALRAGAGNVIVVDISDYRLEFARKLGVKHAINAKKDDVKEKVYEILPNGPDIVFEAAGALEAADMTFNLVRRGTRVNIFGVIVPGEMKISPADVHFLETRVDASFSVTPKVMMKSIDLMQKKLIDPSVIVTHKFSLDNIQEAFDMMPGEERIKIIIEP